jgi:hypothetical protein
MTLRNFDEFWRAALGDKFTPFGYQRRLAEDPECKSRLIDIPTGCGKTAAVVPAPILSVSRSFKQGDRDPNHGRHHGLESE